MSSPVKFCSGININLIVNLLLFIYIYLINTYHIAGLILVAQNLLITVTTSDDLMARLVIYS